MSRARHASANKRSPPQAPPQIARSPRVTPIFDSASVIAAAAAGSLSGGNRGVFRSGASIMWPLKRATVLGGLTACIVVIAAPELLERPQTTLHTGILGQVLSRRKM